MVVSLCLGSALYLSVFTTSCVCTGLCLWAWPWDAVCQVLPSTWVRNRSCLVHCSVIHQVADLGAPRAFLVCPPSCHRSTRIMDRCYHVWLHLGAKESHAGALPTEPSVQPLIAYSWVPLTFLKPTFPLSLPYRAIGLSDFYPSPPPLGKIKAVLTWVESGCVQSSLSVYKGISVTDGPWIWGNSPLRVYQLVSVCHTFHGIAEPPSSAFLRIYIPLWLSCAWPHLDSSVLRVDQFPQLWNFGADFSSLFLASIA